MNIKYVLAVCTAAAALAVPAAAGAVEPSDLVFTQKPGGKYIYCNNHELIRSVDLADNSNMNPKYIMNNEGLTPDKYALFASFLNRTDIDSNTNLESYAASSRGFDIELDVMFRAQEDTVITLEKLGFEVPEHRSFILNDIQYTAEDEWGCFYCWSSYLGMPIRQLNSGSAYQSDPIEETVFEVKAGETVWLSDFIDNYREIPFCRSVNIMTDFTIDSGVCDVNILAVRSNGALRDRSNINRSPAYGSYYRDRQYKGISDGLNEVTAELEYTISDDDPAGILPVTVYNQYKPEGNTVEKWYTHLNPRADQWSYELCAESDMLAFSYYDPMKDYYYGSGVPEDERSPYYVFDTRHTDISEYDKSYGSSSAYIPNRELTEEDGTELACNLGNYGVIYNYKIKITNNGNKQRYLTYCLATSSNNIVYLKDSEGNVVNGYALCKGTRTERVSDNMACMTIPAQTVSEYTVCVILTPNYSGGMQNYFRLSDYPQIIETYETERSGIEKDRFFTGREYYKWEGTTLYLSSDRESWRSVTLPSEVVKDIAGNVNEYSLTYAGDGYLLRPALYDAGVYWHADPLFRTVHLLDENFGLRASYTFGSYPQAAAAANGVYYVKTSGTMFRSTTEFKWWDMVYTQLPCWNYGTYSALLDGGRIKLSVNGADFEEVEYLGLEPDYIDSYGKYYYFTEGRALYLSSDGVYWEGVMASEKIRTFEVIGEELIINGSEKHPLPRLCDDNIVIKYGGKYIGTEKKPFINNGLAYVPVRDIAEFMGAGVDWDDGMITLRFNGTEAVIDTASSEMTVGSETFETAPVIITDGAAYAPLRSISEALGCSVEYDEALHLVTISR